MCQQIRDLSYSTSAALLDYSLRYQSDFNDVKNNISVQQWNYNVIMSVQQFNFIFK